MGEARDRAALLSWLLFAATGLGPFCSQAVHFTRIHQESAYPTNRYCARLSVTSRCSTRAWSLRRWFLEIAKRPAVQRARSAGKDLPKDGLR